MKRTFWNLWWCLIFDTPMEMIGQLFWPSAVHLGVEWKHQAIALIRLVGKMFISQLTCHFHRETAISRPSENRGTTENVTWRPTLSLFRSPFCTCPILFFCCMSLCVCECEWVSMNEWVWARIRMFVVGGCNLELGRVRLHTMPENREFRHLFNKTTFEHLSI